MAEAAPKFVVPLELRPALALNLSPFVWGGLVAGVLVLLALVFRALVARLGIDPQSAPADIGFATRVALVASISIGYTLGASRWVFEAQTRDYQELDIPLGDGEAARGPLEVTPEQLRRSRLAGCAGVAFFLLTVEGPGALAGQQLGAAWISLHALSYMLVLGVIFFWIAGRAAYFSIGRSIFQAALDRLEIDVLDREPLRIFGRIGQRNALIWVVGISLGLLAFVNPEIRIAKALIVLVPLLLVSTAIIMAALLLPARGLHARLVAAKAEELARVEAAIRGDLEALAGSPIQQRQPPPSLADLIAYRGLVESAPTWPFDGSTLRRLGLYMLIPVASWIGGALMERAVDVVLG